MKIKRILISLIVCIAVIASVCTASGCSESDKYFSGTWKVVFRQQEDGLASICDDDFLVVKNKKFTLKSQVGAFESGMKYFGSSGYLSEDGVNLDWGFAFELTDKKLRCSVKVISDGVIRLCASKIEEDGSYDWKKAVWVWYLVRCNDETAKFASFDKTKFNGEWNRYVPANDLYWITYSAEKWTVDGETVKADYTLNNGGNKTDETEYSWKAASSGEYAHTGVDNNGEVSGFMCLSADGSYDKIYVMYIKDFKIKSYNKYISADRSVETEYKNFAVLTKA
ncbi:MAG: hypothetical protein K2L42_02695 [Clostridia bacterium]|nr:hypothetical protein [Clostridia bacterium]